MFFFFFREHNESWPDNYCPMNLESSMKTKSLGKTQFQKRSKTAEIVKEATKNTPFLARRMYYTRI